MAVIELDPSPTAPIPDSRPPLHVFRPLALIAGVVLLLLLGGAAPPARLLWRPLGSIDLAGESVVVWSGDRVVTLSELDRTMVLSVWRMDPPRQVWTRPLPEAPSPPDGIVLSAYARLAVDGGTVLVAQPDFTTVAVDLRTGRTLFTAPDRVTSGPGGVGLVAETVFRPGASADLSDAGELHISSDGRPFREPPQRTDLHGIDLSTGRELWTLPLRGSAYTLAVDESLLAVSDEKIQVVDPPTGRVRWEHDLTGGGWADVIDRTVVIFGVERTTAYDLATLTPRWDTPTPPLADTITGARCDGVICRRVPTGVEVLDPASGAVGWRAGKDASLRRQGSSVIEYDSVSQRPARVLDAATGRPTAELEGWQTLSTYGSGEVLFSKIEPGGKRMSFAVVRAGKVQPLGYADSIVRDCRADDGLIACRNDEGVVLFAYRP